jgi:hypothetical protein
VVEKRYFRVLIVCSCVFMFNIFLNTFHFQQQYKYLSLFQNSNKIFSTILAISFNNFKLLVLKVLEHFILGSSVNLELFTENIFWLEFEDILYSVIISMGALSTKYCKKSQKSMWLCFTVFYKFYKQQYHEVHENV